MTEQHGPFVLEMPTVQLSGKKSFKRYWNQLSRCQRNLIFSAIFIISLTIFLNYSPESTPVNKPQIVKIEEPPLVVATAAVVLYEDDQQQLEEQNIEPKAPVQEEATHKIVEQTVHRGMTFAGPKNNRQKAVVDAFKHSWAGYTKYAWGHDNFKPISKTYSEWFALGLTLVDSLDTMYIMNLQDEFKKATKWVADKLHFTQNRNVNLFEVTIRVLGGLLSAYHLSGDPMFLNKSIDLGNRLMPCFNSPSGIPYSDVNLKLMVAQSPTWLPDSSTSEVTTLQLEFRDLSRSSGNSSYEQAASLVNTIIHGLEKNDGMVPIFINTKTGQFRNFATITLGARGDSYYEYLLKQWIQTGKKDGDDLIEDYKLAIHGVMKQLVKHTAEHKYTFIGELVNGKDFKAKMDHLTCYLPGTLLLGYKNGMPESHLKLAIEILNTCMQTYLIQPTGLAPEISYFTYASEDNLPDIYVKSADSHNLLRPEFIESLYYFYALTGNKTYQEWGWRIFKSFEDYTRVENGYTSIGNVQNPTDTRPRDMMESFWLGETLKYFYLLFSDDRNEIDLNKFVFNSEAHLLPI